MFRQESCKSKTQELATGFAMLDGDVALRLDIVRQQIARVNASLASRSALRGIDPCNPLPNPGTCRSATTCKRMANPSRMDGVTLAICPSMCTAFLGLLTNRATGLTASVTVTPGTVA